MSWPERALLAGALCCGAAAFAHGQTAKPPSCGSAEYRQFDFWVGDWDVFEVNNRDTIVAHARVDLILDGCALRESYDGRNGLSGESFSIYDAGRQVWHQSWVTNRGQLLIIEGTLEGGGMVLSGPFPVPNAKPGLIRGVWYIIKDGVRETAETSEDGGKNWKPLFDVVFRRHTP